MAQYSVGTWRDYGDQRNNRLAVYCHKTNVWYFPKRYGMKAATQLCNKMNKENK